MNKPHVRPILARPDPLLPALFVLLVPVELGVFDGLAELGPGVAVAEVDIEGEVGVETSGRDVIAVNPVSVIAFQGECRDRVSIRNPKQLA